MDTPKKLHLFLFSGPTGFSKTTPSVFFVCLREDFPKAAIGSLPAVDPSKIEAKSTLSRIYRTRWGKQTLGYARVWGEGYDRELRSYVWVAL